MKGILSFDMHGHHAAWPPVVHMIFRLDACDHNVSKAKRIFVQALRIHDWLASCAGLAHVSGVPQHLQYHMLFISEQLERMHISVDPAQSM